MSKVVTIQRNNTLGGKSFGESRSIAIKNTLSGEQDLPHASQRADRRSPARSHSSASWGSRRQPFTPSLPRRGLRPRPQRSRGGRSG